jgi:hypothetical protein
VVLDFEGVRDDSFVGSFYNGVDGPNYGIVFGRTCNGLVDEDARGNANIANEPSPSTVLWFFGGEEDAYMTVHGGFTELSFQYASRYDATITVYDGLDGSGNVLASVLIPKTGICGQDGIPACGDPTGEYGIWLPLTVPFSGVAKSVRFTGPLKFVMIDDVVLVPAGLPSCSKTTYWLWNPTTNKVVGELLNNSAGCLAVPYNIEVRPCTVPKKPPVYLSLKNATLGPVKAQNEFVAPYYLWGDAAATGDVYKNKKPLPKGAYYLDSRVDGVLERITFTKTC